MSNVSIRKFEVFVQGTYDGNTDQTPPDNADIRLANNGTAVGKKLIYGITFKIIGLS